MTLVNLDARKLLDTYYDLNPDEASAQERHLRANPGIDPTKFWDDVEETFSNWLDLLREKPERALATTNWHGKVTKAYFTMKGVKPLPKTKKEMLTIYLVFIAPFPPKETGA
jgi:hypothetical protein